MKEEGWSVDKIKAKAKEIEARVKDPETAHVLKDELYHDFIQHVSKHADGNLSAMAKEVLKTQKIQFPRWFA